MKTKLCIGIFLLLAATYAPAQTNSLTALLQQGLFEEQANRNLDAAIADYQSLALQFDQDRQLAATAVFRLGECYRAQGRTSEAATQYQRILHDFADQQTLVTLSREDLAGMGMAGTEAKPVAAQNGAVAIVTDDEDREIQRIQQMIQNSPDLINAPSDGTTPLVKAAYNGWLKVAAYLLDHGAGVNIPSPDVRWTKELTDFKRGTPLLAAVAAGNKAMVKFLIDRGADINFQGENGETALHLAAQKGFQAVVEVLLASHADVDARDTFGRPPLFSAVSSVQMKIIQTLLAAGADAKAKNNRGQTALNYAIGTSPETVQTLLAAGTNPNTEDVLDGRTPLSYAAQKDSTEVVKLLLAAKANPNLGTLDAPLLCAIHEKNAATAEALLQSGAKPDTLGKVDWQPHSANFHYDGALGRGLASPLWLAVNMDQLPLVQLLLKHKADPNDAQTDGQSVLFRALADTNIFAALLEAGGTAETCQTDGWTLLDGAVSEKSIMAVQLLLKFKADPNHSQIQGQSILFSALSETNILEALLDAGAKVEPVSQDANNRTPLGVAANDNNAVAVRILLKHGADPNLRDANGATPLHWAAYRPAGSEVFELLLAHRADPNVRSSNGETALDVLKKSTTQNSFAPSPGMPPRPRLNHPLPGMPGGMSDPQPTPTAGELADLLRQHGALDKLPDWDRITVSRPAANFSFAIFRKGTNDWNQFTLLEAILNYYLTTETYWVHGPNGMNSGYSAGSMLPFPDLTHVIIMRPRHGATNETLATVNLLNSTDGIEVAKDQPLEFGDVVEIPERDHALGESPVGLLNSQRVALVDYVKGSAQLVAHGQKVELPFYRLGNQATLGALLDQPDAQKTLLSSSDLSRVKVIRHNSNTGEQREWILDCSPPTSFPGGNPPPPLSYQWSLGGNNPPPSSGLWLRDGDVIEVPEKP